MDLKLLSRAVRFHSPQMSRRSHFCNWHGKNHPLQSNSDDRFLVKPAKSAVAMMPDADREPPYEGAKEMLLVDDVENREFLRELLEAMYQELPVLKKKKK